MIEEIHLYSGRDPYMQQRITTKTQRNIAEMLFGVVETLFLYFQGEYFVI